MCHSFSGKASLLLFVTPQPLGERHTSSMTLKSVAALSTSRSEASVSQRDTMEYLRSVGYTNMEEMHRILDVATNPFSSYRMHKTRKGKGSMPQVCLHILLLDLVQHTCLPTY